MKHTPGPWKCWYEGSGDYIVTAEDEDICSISRPDAHFMATGPGAPINEANARLIAKAPEMYELLCDILEYGHQGSETTDAIRKLREELDK